MRALQDDVLLVGCGHMGGALLHRWRQVLPARFHVIKPTPLADSFRSEGLTYSRDLSGLPADFHPTLIVLAVRPSVLESVLPFYAAFSDSLFLSLAAGKTLADVQKVLGPSSAIVRAMPNLPVSIGAGMSFGNANERVTPAQKKDVETLFSATGAFAWLEDESLFDVSTALSGCGPGYVYALTEAMTEAGIKLGLPAVFAELLARQTVAGTGAAMLESAESATALRQALANPNTMTEAALRVLAAPENLPSLMRETLLAAVAHAQSAAHTQGRKG